MDQILSLAELDQERLALMREIDAMRADVHKKSVRLAEIDQARDIVKRYGKRTDGSAAPEEKATAASAIMPATPQLTETMTLTFEMPRPVPKARDLIIQAMRGIADVWTDAVKIQEEASKLKGSPIPMGTISPTLSGMKGTVIRRDGMKVALIERLKEIEPPAGGSGDGSSGDVAERSNAPDS